VSEQTKENNNKMSVDDLLNAFDQFPVPPLSQNMQDHFWMRFKEEFAQEEQKRQQLQAGKPFSLSSFWYNLWHPDNRWTLAFATFSIVSCLLVLLGSRLTYDDQYHQKNPVVTQHKKLQQTHKTKLKNKAIIEQEPKLLQHLALYKNMELFENFEIIQHISEKEGS